MCSRRTSSGKLGCFGDATSALEKLSTSKCHVINNYPNYIYNYIYVVLCNVHMIIPGKKRSQ